MLLYNAKIFGREDAEYVLIRGNKIEKIGKGNLPESTRRIDLKGATILPGFCDSHTHLINIALMHDFLDLTNKKRDEVLKIIGKECRKRRVIIGRGWDESIWEKKEYLNREELDSYCKNKIVFLIREDGHLGVLNSKAMKEFNIDIEEGIIREKEIEKIMKKLKIGKPNFNYAQEYALKNGITAIHDFVNLDTLREYFRMKRMGNLKLRIFANFYHDLYRKIKNFGFYTGFGDEFLKIGGLKIFSDGSIGAKTAATVYRDGERVEPMLDSKKIKKIVKDANSHGIMVLTHAIGNFAIDEVLKAYKDTKGNRIEHFELVREEYLDRIGNITLSMQPNFLKWAKRGGLYEERLGKEWLRKNNPYRKILNHGINLLFGSDCMPMNPLFGIRMAVESEYEMQRIKLNDAILSYTLGAKYMDMRLGEIKVGNIADIIAVKNLDNLSKAEVILTIVNGKIMYSHIF